MKGLTMPFAMKQRNLRTMLLGIGLIILTNAVVLAGVAYNRAGEAESSITLTERELNLPYLYGIDKENSGIALRFNYRSESTSPSGYRYYGSEAKFLTSEKLAELGFDVAETDSKGTDDVSYQRQKEREVTLVLEYNGEAYQAALAAAQKHLDELKAEVPLEELMDKISPDTSEWRDKNKLKQAEENLEHEQSSASRLFVIDAGLDEEVLRKQYPNNKKYLLLKGLISIYVANNKDETRTINGYIRRLSINAIHIPLEHHRVLDAVMAEDVRLKRDEQPRYQVMINIGKRLEPWVVGVKGI